MPRFFIVTTRGLEAVARDEIGAIDGATVLETGYRRVVFRYDGADLRPLVGLRTVDDLFLELGVWSEITRPRSTLALIEDLATGLELWSAVATLATLRPIPESPVFSVTANFVGKRNYSSDEIKIAVANGVDTSHGWRYSPDVRQSDLNIRLFIEHDIAIVGVRVGKNALHERDYKREQRPGSLKPPVARAMLTLAQLNRTATICDPFCGTGTILIEAMQAGYHIIGGDISPDALTTTRLNANHANVAPPLIQWNAQTLPIPTASLDAIVTNLPWGKQVTVDETLTHFYASACDEMARVVKPEGTIVVLTSLPDLLTFHAPTPITAQEISLFGQRPTIGVYRL